jgi:hypothetical protein
MDNVDAKDWGKDVWIPEHKLASYTPVGAISQELKTAALARIYSLCHMTPCSECRTHYNAFVQANPPKFETGEQIEQWWLQAHNNINRLLGRAEWTLTQLRQRFPRANGPNGLGGGTTAFQPLAPAHGYDTTKYLTNYPLVRFQTQGVQDRGLGFSAPAPRVGAGPLPGWTAAAAKTISSKSIKQVPLILTRAQVQAQRVQPKRALPLSPLTGIYPKHPPLGMQTLQWRNNMSRKTGSGNAKKKSGCGGCGRRRMAGTGGYKSA